MPDTMNDAPAARRPQHSAEDALRELEELAAAWVERQRQRLLQAGG